MTPLMRPVIKSSTEESFREQQAVRDGKNNELSEQEKGLKQIKDEIKKAIDGLAKEHDEIKTIQQAMESVSYNLWNKISNT